MCYRNTGKELAAQKSSEDFYCPTVPALFNIFAFNCRNSQNSLGNFPRMEREPGTGKEIQNVKPWTSYVYSKSPTYEWVLFQERVHKSSLFVKLACVRN